jgi:hypothetical protein
MLNIDTTTMLIELTRGDTANIVFSAVDKDGETWTPDAAGIELKFAVGKKVGATPISEVTNVYDGEDLDAFWTITIGGSFWYEKDEDGQVVEEDGSPVNAYKFKDYVYDVQIKTSTGTDTIIGETDDIHPTFRVLGEVATE